MGFLPLMAAIDPGSPVEFFLWGEGEESGSGGWAVAGVQWAQPTSPVTAYLEQGDNPEGAQDR